MAGGYTGKYLIVNLTDGSSKEIKPDETFYKKYLSGYGLGAAVITQNQKAGIDPLSPDSHLGFCSGLLTGTGAYFSGRLMVVGKSPLTGGWGDANVGGFFSRELKRTGFDAVFFTGKAEKPVWVFLSDTGIEIKDASDLWGKDTIETETIVKKQLDNKRLQVCSIGISGEKLSLISGIVTDKGRIAARCGMGAVMGSKNLKAFAVRGKQKTPVAKPEVLKKINKIFINEFKKRKTPDKFNARFLNFFSKIMAWTGISVPAQAGTVREILRKFGTPGFTLYSALVGDMPIKNWAGSGLSDYPAHRAAKTSDESVLKRQTRKYACQSCPLGCGGIVNIEKGRYSGTKGHKPEYETIGAFGGLILHDDLDAIIEINEMCNRAGIDTISTGGSVAFAIECFENGLIDKNQTNGLNLSWGKTEEIIKLTEMIINREGFGDILADGVKAASLKIKKGSEKYAIHAGGQELPMHDPRLDPGFAIAYQCEPTPGHHTISSFAYPGLFGIQKKYPVIKKMVRSAKDKTSKNIQLYAAGSFYMQLVNACGMCELGAISITLPVVEYINAVTGWGITPDEYLKTGERILALRKVFNVREGIKPEDHKMNSRAIGTPPLKKGPLKGVTIDNDKLISEFYSIAGWDPVTGGPNLDKMKELGLDNV